MRLLSLFEAPSKIESITISANIEGRDVKGEDMEDETAKASDGTTWIEDIWTRFGSSLEQAYKNKGYTIQFTSGQGEDGDSVSIDML